MPVALNINHIDFYISFPVCPCLTLKITYFSVPQFVDLKDKALLECVFDLEESEDLQSVKWYRRPPREGPDSMQEFYSYQPGRNPPAKHYKWSGIRVDVRTVKS